LRDEFDRSFANPPSVGTAAVDDLLLIALGGDQHVMRLADISGLFVDKAITPLPSPVAELLGIAGFRGTVLPVFDLSRLLGGPKATAPRWLVVAAAGPIAFAFDGFGGYLRVRSDAIVAGDGLESAGRAGEILQDEIVRPMIYLATIVETVRHLVQRGDGADRLTA
jgi:chemotaxis signal transduction protein